MLLEISRVFPLALQQQNTLAGSRFRTKGPFNHTDAVTIKPSKTPDCHPIVIPSLLPCRSCRSWGRCFWRGGVSWRNATWRSPRGRVFPSWRILSWAPAGRIAEVLSSGLEKVWRLLATKEIGALSPVYVDFHACYENSHGRAARSKLELGAHHAAISRLAQASQGKHLAPLPFSL